MTLEETPATCQITTFTAAADLNLRDGDTVYAVNVSSGGPSPLSVNGVNFFRSGASGADVSGVTVSSPNTADNWGTQPAYGATADDDNLEDLMHDIRWAPSPNTITVDAAVTAGKIYDLRLLLSENFFTAPGQRACDMAVEGYKIADEFDILAVAGG